MGRRIDTTKLVAALLFHFRDGATAISSPSGYDYNDYTSTTSQGCTPAWIADGYCDGINNNDNCDYDGGDCCECDCVDDVYECGVAGYDCLNPSYGGLYGCEAAPAVLPCSVDAQQTWVVEDPVQARAMAANVSCSGGSFEVHWRGGIVLDAPIYVAQGTVLNVTGAGSTAVIEGNGGTRLFTVDNATLHVSSVSISNGVSSIGGAIAAVGARLTFSRTSFRNNSAESNGGALWLSDSIASWSGDTEFVENTALSGGAMLILDGSSVSWAGDTNFTSNTARAEGGAVGSVALSELLPESSALSMNGPTVFWNNTAGTNGGALALLGGLNVEIRTLNASFVGNSAGAAGGAVFMSQTAIGPSFTDVDFISNSAEVGGAVSVVGSGYARDVDTGVLDATTFDRCRFVGNRADTRGGAVASAAGEDRFLECNFTGNTGGTGGALRLAGSTYLEYCFFEDNVSNEGEGAAVSNVGTMSQILFSYFGGNVFNCEPDMFLDYKSGDPYDAACSGCEASCDGCGVEPPLVPECTGVMANTRSEGGPATLEMISIDKGYWRATNSSRDVLACYNADACLGGLTGTAEYCLEGYEGPYCAVCSEQHTAQLSFTCKDCSNSAGGIAVAVFLAAAALSVAVVVVLYVVSGEVGDKGHKVVGRLKRYVPLQSLKIVIVAWQILTQFTSVAGIVYPDVYQRLLNILDVINLDLSWILSTGCVLDMDFHDRLLLSTIGPIIALLFLGGIYAVSARINRGNAEVLQVIWNKHVSVVLLLTFLVYSSVSSVVFQAFACETLADDRTYLRADYRIECDSSRHQGFQAYAGIMAVLYAAGIPALYSALLFRDRDVLKLDPIDREDPARVTSTSQLWQPYKPSAYYFEVIECGRRISLAGLVVFIYPNTASQIAITLMMAFVFAVLSEAFAPYASTWDTWTSRMSHAVIFMSVYVALLLKVDVSDEQGSSQEVFEAVLVSAHAFMILTILVETVMIAYSLRVEQHDSPVCKIRPVEFEDNPFASHVQKVEQPYDEKNCV